jgi:hypothetical protein
MSDQAKEWAVKMAEAEVGAEISAGGPPFFDPQADAFGAAGSDPGLTGTAADVVVGQRGDASTAADAPRRVTRGGIYGKVLNGGEDGGRPRNSGFPSVHGNYPSERVFPPAAQDKVQAWAGDVRDKVKSAPGTWDTVAEHVREVASTPTDLGEELVLSARRIAQLIAPLPPESRDAVLAGLTDLIRHELAGQTLIDTITSAVHGREHHRAGQRPY